MKLTFDQLLTNSAREFNPFNAYNRQLSRQNFDLPRIFPLNWKKNISLCQILIRNLLLKRNDLTCISRVNWAQNFYGCKKRMITYYYTLCDLNLFRQLRWNNPIRKRLNGKKRLDWKWRTYLANGKWCIKYYFYSDWPSWCYESVFFYSEKKN